jgi:DNA-binding HxlR family transcriptional regulator
VGVVRREIFPEVPPRVEYSTTELGVSLNGALEPLCRWGERHFPQLAAADSHAALPRKACSLPVSG